MLPPREAASPNDGSPSRSDAASVNPPLVIISEHGRHSEASRRLVRAQAARASAAQSRETRARNREDRHQRGGPQSLGESSSTPPIHVQHVGSLGKNAAPPVNSIPGQPEVRIQLFQGQPQRLDSDVGEAGGISGPLVGWVSTVLQLTASSFVADGAVLPDTGNSHPGIASSVPFQPGDVLSDRRTSMEQMRVTGVLLDRKLPIALPRGFATLVQRIRVSDAFLVLISRTACIDFASPGVEYRLHELLFDIVMTPSVPTSVSLDQGEHAIQGHLRIACACLIIFQGQRADVAAFTHDQRYDAGLQSAWVEVMALDQSALKEPNSAEVALWAMFIISVTCGSTIAFFEKLLWELLQDLQLRYWEQVRHVLLEFIYPGSFLDAPCKQFYDQLQEVGRGRVATS